LDSGWWVVVRLENAVGGNVAGDTKTNVKHTQKCIGTQIAMKSEIKGGAGRERKREKN